MRGDEHVRHLYMTAVLARTAQMRWSDAGQVALRLDCGDVGGLAAKAGGAGRIMDALAVDCRNPNDVVARSCGAAVLAEMAEPPADVRAALRSVLSDPAREIRETASLALGV
jgi:hypothetical protein